MGLTLAYRGRLADPTRVEDFEDRLLDFALEFGGLAQIWRSYPDDRPQRMVRGVVLNLAPGQEPASLLLSPEGWLIGLTDVEEAERGLLTAPPWCSIDTLFGPLEGHTVLVEMLAALRREFLPDLEVADEGGYHETHDLAELAGRRALAVAGIKGPAAPLAGHGLSREAAGNPALLRRHVERLAALVRRILGRPSEHPPITFPDDGAEAGVPPAPEAEETLWDELFKHNRRQQERLQRALEERRSHGEDDEAFENALGDLGLEVPGKDAEAADGPWDDEGEPAVSFEEEAGSWDEAAAGDPFEAEDGPYGSRHPLLARALDLLKRLHEVFRGAGGRFTPSLWTLHQGAGDTMGGLAQALSARAEDDPDDYGLRVVQLKRAVRGAAFARGALSSLRDALTAEQFAELQGTLDRMAQDVFQELSRLRSEHAG